jgi:streptomycin 6-kinase
MNEKLLSLSRLWGLENLQPLPCGPHVFKAYQNKSQRDVVLKFARSTAEFQHETLTLRHYRGQGCVTLFATDAPALAILMEHVTPGVSLKTFFPEDDANAVAIAAQVIKRIHASSLNEIDAHSFPKLKDWIQIFTHERNRVLPKKQLDKAQSLARELLNSTTYEVLLHADLHHQNILSSDREAYLAIDPHGIMGDPAFEPAAFIRNPIPEIFTFTQARDLIRQRLTLFAELLNLDVERLRAWSFVHALLAVAWCLEDQQDFEPMLKIATLID